MVTYLLALQSKLFLGFGQCNFPVSPRFGHLDILLKLFHKYFLTQFNIFARVIKTNSLKLSQLRNLGLKGKNVQNTHKNRQNTH